MNMDRRLWIFPALALLLAGACSKKTGGSLKLAKDTDSVAYVIGIVRPDSQRLVALGAVGRRSGNPRFDRPRPKRNFDVKT